MRDEYPSGGAICENSATPANTWVADGSADPARQKRPFARLQQTTMYPHHANTRETIMTGAIRREFNSSCHLVRLYAHKNRQRGFRSLFPH